MPTGSYKRGNKRMSSPIADYSSDEEDKIGALIYKSSKTAKLLRAVNKENAEKDLCVLIPKIEAKLIQKKQLIVVDEELNRRKKKRAEVEKEETARVKVEKERVEAQRALQWVKEASICPPLRKRLLLLMTLIRTNPRSPPSCYPSHGTVLSDGFHWAAYPPLDNLLRENMRTYYELSTEHSQTKVQVEFNNMMVQLIRKEATKHGWKFDHKVFDDKKIRDRIRCFYKAHMQNAKKRLKTMLKNPEKKANIKDLATLYHLIEEKGQNTGAILETMLKIKEKKMRDSMIRESYTEQKATRKAQIKQGKDAKEKARPRTKATIKAKKEAELPKAVHKPKSHVVNKRLNSLLYAANELESLDKAQPKSKRAKFNPCTKEGDGNISYMAAWANIADQFNISHHHIDRSL